MSDELSLDNYTEYSGSSFEADDITRDAVLQLYKVCSDAMKQNFKEISEAMEKNGFNNA